ncbi:MAG: hypothetical protein ACLFVU_08955 [Phycisphaerae bacterium]
MEVIQEAFAAPNLLITGLLCLMVLYWLMVILGALDLDFLNFDLDADTDVDVDMDVDADFDADADVDADSGLGVEGAESFFESFLGFFYVGTVPVMILISLFVVCLWTMSMLINHYFNPGLNFWWGMVLLVPNLLGSLLLVKVVAVPFKEVFKRMREDPNAAKPVVGRLCRVVSSEITNAKFGQADVRSQRGAPVRLLVKTAGDEVLHKGDEAVVIRRDKASGVYTVEPIDLES